MKQEQDNRYLEIIKSFEESLKGYEIKLKENPNSFFYSGLVSSTKDYIKELKKISKHKKQ